MSTNAAGQSSNGENYKCSLLVKNLPFFSGHTTVIRYFSDFGVVKEVRFIHKDGNHTRSAEVEMELPESVAKILEQKDPHVIDGKPVQVMSFRGTKVHENEFVLGRYHLNFERLFESGPAVKSNRDDNNRTAQACYIELENAFHQFEYTTITVLHRNGFYDGHAVVKFKDDENKVEILRIANEKFPGCLKNAMRVPRSY